MSIPSIRDIVKESIREAFYSKEIIAESNEDCQYTGIVDSYGSLQFRLVKEDEPDWHNLLFPGVRGDRWRFACGDSEVVWTNEPSEDSMFAVENFLIKRGEHPKIHNSWNGKIRRNISENVLVNEQLINEQLFGQKLYIMAKGFKLQSIITKNTKDYEGEYRISWFNRDRSRAAGHIGIDKDETNYILENKDLPEQLKSKFVIYFESLGVECRPEDIKIELIEKFEESKKLQETLFLLEQFDRELDIWISGKYMS